MAVNYVLLERIVVGEGGAASVVISDIPQTGYDDLKIVISARGTAASNQTVLTMKLNSLTSGYADKYVFGGGTSIGAGSFSSTSAFLGDIPAATATTNTFGNQEVYITNYNSSNTKSWKVDSAAETNGTVAYMELTAGSNTTTSAITSLTFTLTSGSLVQYSTFSVYGIASLGTTPTVYPKASGGDIITNDGTYWYHAFISSGVFKPLSGISCDILQIAGGGAGAANGGGGGAGGLLAYSAQALTSTNYPVTVGAGGVWVAGSASGGSGGPSQFGSLTASAGGGGGTGYGFGIGGVAGGSGGGAPRAFTSVGGAATPAGQGNKGGDCIAAEGSGGGGGAGAAGGNGSGGGQAGNGGIGLSTYSSWGAATITGQNSGGTYYYAGGGGGGSANPQVQGNPGLGGLGGGGNGNSQSGNGTSGTVNTGGGGGGSGATPGNGGSGIVIVRYSIV